MQQDLNEAFLFGSKSGNDFLKELEDSSEKKKELEKKEKKGDENFTIFEDEEKKEKEEDENKEKKKEKEKEEKEEQKKEKEKEENKEKKKEKEKEEKNEQKKEKEKEEEEKKDRDWLKNIKKKDMIKEKVESKKKYVLSLSIKKTISKPNEKIMKCPFCGKEGPGVRNHINRTNANVKELTRIFSLYEYFYSCYDNFKKLWGELESCEEELGGEIENLKRKGGDKEAENALKSEIGEKIQEFKVYSPEFKKLFEK